MNRLSGKVALVTGAASGIGKAITENFLKQGASVVAIDINLSRLNELKSSLADYAKQLLVVEADLIDDEAPDHLSKMAVNHFGSLDILVNNAGIMDHFQPASEVEDEMWHKVLKVNLDVPFKLMRSALRIFLPKQYGNIINIASVGGLYGGRAGAAYTSSKFGLIGLTKNTGYIYAKSGIRCNAIAPGGINTHISETIDYNKITPLVNERIMSGMALNPRMGEPDEIASVAVFLASDESRFVNASVIVADGGWTAY
ncbi:MAG: SDR family oxidoreductase [Bacteroidota bacterium]